MIRLANLRHQAMVEPDFRMILLRNVITRVLHELNPHHIGA